MDIWIENVIEYDVYVWNYEEKHNPGAGMENVKRNANAVVMNS